MIEKIIAYVPAIVGLFILGLAVFINNPKSIKNRIFALFNVMTTLWLSALFLSDISTTENKALWTFRFGLFFGQLVPLGFYYLSLVFPRNSRIKKKRQIIFGSIYFILALCALTPLNVSTVEILDFGVRPLKTGILYSFSDLMTIAMVIAGVVVLIKKYRRSSSVVEKSQLRLILIGISAVVVTNILTGIVLLQIIQVDSVALLFGNLSFVIFSALVTYAVIKHRLFDIRTLIVRSIVYLLSIAIIVLVYTAILLTTGSVLLDLDSLGLGEIIFFMLLTLLVAATYQPIVQFFNKYTTRIFFRDVYDTQIVLNKVSSVIVANIEPHKLQKGALTAINEALKPTFAGFLLTEVNGKLKKGDVVGQHWDMHNPEKLRSILKLFNRKITTYDDLHEKDKKIKEYLRLEDISVIAPLVTKDDIIGYLILGAKKSGNIYNTQDINLLNITTNELAVALQNAQRFEAIQAFNVTLQEKVTQATRELQQTNKRLIALDEAKDEFISMASHQLRTPLTSIKGYLSMLLEGDLGKVSAQQERALREAFGSSQRMVFLIADFLNVSRIRTGKFTIEPAVVDLPQIITDEINQLREIAESKSITIKYEAPAEFPRLKLDDNKIRQVIMNIIDNAIYYTPAQGVVTVQLFSDGKEAVFKVTDTGIGVPKSEQHKLFTKFYRAGNARKVRPDGTGLGLFMAQKIVVAQDGAIIFESVEGKGSTFGFRFPLAKVKA